MKLTMEKCKVVLLPSKNSSRLTITEPNEIRYENSSVGVLEIPDVHPQHLYFTSNEEIDGNTEWVMYNEPGKEEVRRINNFNGKRWKPECNLDAAKAFHKKIVASTDSVLGLLEISELFIKEYVKSNGSITEVERGNLDFYSLLSENYDEDNWTCLSMVKSQDLEDAAFDKAFDDDLNAFNLRQDKAQFEGSPRNHFQDGYNRGWTEGTQWRKKTDIEFFKWIFQMEGANEFNKRSNDRIPFDEIIDTIYKIWETKK